MTTYNNMKVNFQCIKTYKNNMTAINESTTIMAQKYTALQQVSNQK